MLQWKILEGKIKKQSRISKPMKFMFLTTVIVKPALIVHHKNQKLPRDDNFTTKPELSNDLMKLKKKKPAGATRPWP